MYCLPTAGSLSHRNTDPFTNGPQSPSALFSDKKWPVFKMNFDLSRCTFHDVEPCDKTVRASESWINSWIIPIYFFFFFNKLRWYLAVAKELLRLACFLLLFFLNVSHVINGTAYNTRFILVKKRRKQEPDKTMFKRCGTGKKQILTPE